MCESLYISEIFSLFHVFSNCEVKVMISTKSAYRSSFERKIVTRCLCRSFHLSEDTDRLKYYIVTVTFQGHQRSKVMVSNERLCMFLSMNNCNYMSNGTVSKTLALLYKKIVNAQSHDQICT